MGKTKMGGAINATHLISLWRCGLLTQHAAKLCSRVTRKYRLQVTRTEMLLSDLAEHIPKVSR